MAKALQGLEAKATDDAATAQAEALASMEEFSAILETW